MDVLGIGQISCDSVALADHLPPPGGKADALELVRLPGGQVATTLLGCARLGLSAALVGSVGDDEAGEVALAPLRSAGVDLSAVMVRRGVPTRSAQIWVDRGSGERTVLGYRHPRIAVEPGEVPLERVRTAGALHLDSTDGRAARPAAAAAREAGVPVVLDADAPGAGLAELLALVDFPVVARPFAETFFGTFRVRKALERLVAGGARMAVVTLGRDGALARIGDREIACPAFAVEALDTTGAGDGFMVGFHWGLCEGLDPEGVLRAAAAVAALNCRGQGAQGGLPDEATLRRFLDAEEPGSWVDPDP